LEDHLRVTHFAELYSSYLTLEDGSLGINVRSDGGFDLPKYDFYAYTETVPNLILLTGSIQPISLGQYEVCDQVVGFVERLGCKTVVAIGGYRTPVAAERGRVYAVVDGASLRERLQGSSVKMTSGGQVNGACGLVLGLGRQRGMSCLGLLGATDVTYPDAIAAKSVVKTLAWLFGLSLDYGELDRAMAEIESRMERFGEMREAALRSVQQPREPEERGRPEYYV
jgi:proteasome assembly chaperone (PAC2) family protein